jgi:YebC/PmpR family DNA-binding regulatory protein
MGAQWKQAGREVAAQKRGQVIGKLVREIIVASKLGGADPDLNARLLAAVEKARKHSVTRDTIERAVKRGSGETDENVHFELVTYEGFAPHKIPVIVECLTDNRNRTAPEIRHLFKTGAFGQPGSMAFFFDRIGVVEAAHADRSRDPESDAIEAGAQNLEALESEEIPEGHHQGTRFITDPKDLGAVTSWLSKAGWRVTASELRYHAKNPIELPQAHREQVVEFLHTLDDHDDVHHVYAGLK